MKTKRLGVLIAATLLLSAAGCREGREQGGSGGPSSGAASADTPFGEKQLRASVLTPKDLGQQWAAQKPEFEEGEKRDDGGMADYRAADADCQAAIAAADRVSTRTTGSASRSYTRDSDTAEVASQVTAYRDGGAQKVLGSARTMVDRCEGVEVRTESSTMTFEKLTAPEGGDESLGYRLTYTYKDGPDREDAAPFGMDIFTARVGAQITTVSMKGHMEGEGDTALLGRLLGTAVGRVQAVAEGRTP